MAMIESRKSRRVRKLLQDQLTLAEALKYARGLESTDQHATKMENQTPTDITETSSGKNHSGQNRQKIVFKLQGNSGCAKGDQGKVWPPASSVCDAAKGITLQITVKANKKVRP